MEDEDEDYDDYEYEDLDMEDSPVKVGYKVQHYASGLTGVIKEVDQGYSWVIQDEDGSEVYVHNGELRVIDDEK